MPVNATAQELQEAADEARELALLPDTDEAHRELFHRAAMHFEVEAIRAMFAERAAVEKGEMP